MHRLIGIIICAFITIAIHAQEVKTNLNSHSDTLQAFVDDNNNAYIQINGHSPINTRDIAKLYQVPSSSLLLTTNLSDSDTSGTSQSILVPIRPNKLLLESSGPNCVPVNYVVRPKETMFRIARRYFDLKVDELRKLNHLSSNQLSINQSLLIGWINLTPSETSLPADTTTFIQPVIVDPFHPETPIFQTGVAYWNKSLSNESHLFAMHRSARVNSMIEITNPMFNTKVLVKVIGTIPPTYKSDIALVVSPGVAKKLKILDPRFRAEMRYVE